MGHVNRYMKETCSDVSYPSQAATAVYNDGGLANTAVELMEFDRKGDHMTLRIKSLISKKYSPIGRVNKYAYCNIVDDIS